MAQKKSLLQSCSSQYFRFIASTVRVKQVGKEEWSASFPALLCQQDSSLLVVLNNTQIMSSQDLIKKWLKLYRKWPEVHIYLPKGYAFVVYVYEYVSMLLKCSLEVLVVLLFHTSPFIVLLLE